MSKKGKRSSLLLSLKQTERPFDYQLWAKKYVNRHEFEKEALSAFGLISCGLRGSTLRIQEKEAVTLIYPLEI